KTLDDAQKQLALELKRAVYQEPPESAARPVPMKPGAAKPEDDRYRHSQFAWEKRERTNDKLPGPVREALQIEPPKRSDAQTRAVRDHYLRFVYAGTRGVFDPLNKVLEESAKKLKETEDAVPWVMVSEEMPKRRDAFVLVRGDFQQRGEKVGPEVPAAFPPLRPSGVSSAAVPTRLDLARWLVRP